MPLTAVGVRSAKSGRHGDGHGLYLLVNSTKADPEQYTKSWVLRVQVNGRRRDIGLGSIAALSLAEAREKAAELRKHALNGRDPIVERDKNKRLIPTFRRATQEAHTALRTNWTDKNAAAFLTTLATYAFPKLGNLPVDIISSGHVHDVLAPIWTTKPGLASKVRMRVGQVLNFSHSKGWRATEAPGRSLTLGLPRQPKGSNYKAMPYADVPAFLAHLAGATPTTGRRALSLLIMTAARPGEIRKARWEHIDIEQGNWTRPAEMMKMRDAHTVTLNKAARTLLLQLHQEAGAPKEGLVFASHKGNALSDMALNKVLRDAKVPFDAHGFRSSFRDWAAEQMPLVPDPVAEAALAHAVSDATIAAYKRTKFVEMRRELLQAWSEFLAGKSAGA
ncbi:site-specific integrase [soil metagenome]